MDSSGSPHRRENAAHSDAVASDLSLREVQRRVDEWIRDVGVRYFSELTNLALLTEEVGELARILAREYGEQSGKPEEDPGDLADEMADVLFVLVCLANQTGIDLDEAFRRNLDKKTARDRERHRRNPHLQNPSPSLESGPDGSERA